MLTKGQASLKPLVVTRMWQYAFLYDCQFFCSLTSKELDLCINKYQNMTDEYDEVEVPHVIELASMTENGDNQELVDDNESDNDNDLWKPYFLPNDLEKWTIFVFFTLHDLIIVLSFISPFLDL